MTFSAKVPLRKTLRVTALTTLLVAAAAVVGFSAPKPATAQPDRGAGGHSRTLPLGHAGRWVTAHDGRVVVLHGFNMVAKLPPYSPARVGFGADDAAFLRRHGFTTVRLGIIWKALEPSPGRYDDRYLRSIASTVHLLDKAGITTLLDFHQDLYNERFQGEGAPDWAVQDDGLPAQPQTGFPGNYFAMPAVSRAFDHFWNNDPGPGGVGLQDRYAAAWRHVAKRFRDDDSVLGYDLFNEPFAGSQNATCLNPAGCPLFDQQRLAPFTRKVLEAIRSVDRRHLVWYEPQLTFDFGADTSIGDLGDARSGFAFHAYCASTMGVPSNPPTRAACDRLEQRVLDNAETQSARTGDALLLTEFGATDDLDELRSMTDRADAQMLSWQEWTYFGGDPSAERPTEGIIRDIGRPPSGSNVKRRKLAVLDRPHPLLVAGTPVSWRYDGSVFRLRYTTRAPGCGCAPRSRRTVVWVSPMHFRNGYRVRVSGARVVSRPGAARLVLRTLPRARAVALTVSRR